MGVITNLAQTKSDIFRNVAQHKFYHICVVALHGWLG